MNPTDPAAYEWPAGDTDVDALTERMVHVTREAAKAAVLERAVEKVGPLSDRFVGSWLTEAARWGA